MTGGQSATLSNEKPRPEGISGRDRVTEISTAMAADAARLGLDDTGPVSRPTTTVYQA